MLEIVHPEKSSGPASSPYCFYTAFPLQSTCSSPGSTTRTSVPWPTRLTGVPPPFPTISSCCCFCLWPPGSNTVMAPLSRASSPSPSTTCQKTSSPSSPPSLMSALPGSPCRCRWLVSKTSCRLMALSSHPGSGVWTQTSYASPRRSSQPRNGMESSGRQTASGAVLSTW